MPLSESFSVARICGIFFPFQSNDVLHITSATSPFGQWSVHWR